LELGDAWMPFGFTLEGLRDFLTTDAVKAHLAARTNGGRDELKLIFAPEPPIDPLGQPEATAGFLADYVAIGATGFSLRFEHYSAEHFVEQMSALQSLVRSSGW
jgi:hypothetical protein